MINDSKKSFKQDSFLNKVLSRKKDYSVPSSTRIKTKINDEKYTDFTKFENYKQIEVLKNASVKFNIKSPFFRCYDGVGGAVITHNNEEYINFSSYNYLNLNGADDTVNSVIISMNELGTSVSASRIVSGERSLHRKLETGIADFYEVEDSIVFVSGHATNVSTISCLFGLKDLILYDEISHNSIVQGLKLSDAKSYAFKHNDLEHLELLLSKYRSGYNRVLIVIEGLYSMDGDIPDLPSIVEIKKKYNAFLMVDEAHSSWYFRQKW